MLPLGFQELSVMQPVCGTTRVLFERLKDGFDGFRTRPCPGTSTDRSPPVSADSDPSPQVFAARPASST